MGPAIQKPLLPLRQGGGGGAGLSSPPQVGGRRGAGGSQHTSPAKELLVAVEHGDAGGALRAASAFCLRHPLVLLVGALLLLGAAGLTAWLLPQQPLPAMLAHVAHRERSPRQRAFFEELTQQERELIGAGARPPPAHLQQQRQPQRTGGAASLDALALPRPGSKQAAQQQAQQQQQQPGAQGQPQLDQVQQAAAQQQAQPGGAAGGARGTNDSEPMFNIHKIAGVPQLFGEQQDQR